MYWYRREFPYGVRNLNHLGEWVIYKKRWRFTKLFSIKVKSVDLKEDLNDWGFSEVKDFLEFANE